MTIVVGGEEAQSRLAAFKRWGKGERQSRDGRKGKKEGGWGVKIGKMT